jgi:voltage-gated potassium channel
LTTVDYGDVHPVTTSGQLVGATVAVIGIGLFALPASILASGLIEAARGETVRCPHCGEDFSEEIIKDAEVETEN